MAGSIVNSMRRLPGTPALLLVVGATSVVPLLAVIATGRTLLWRDTARLYDPIRALVVDALRSGSIPGWNPHEALGQPILGQLIHGVLHPVSLVLAALAPDSGAEGLVVAYVAVAAAGAALLVRVLDCSVPAAAGAGLVYAWSGYVLGMSSNLVFLAAGATAPWAVAGLSASGRGAARAVVPGALAVASLHLAGDPQWTVVAVLLGGLLAWDAAGRAGLAWVAGAVALGTALASVQLVPAWLAFQDTARAAGLGAADRAQWALVPWRIPELALPGLFGAPGEDEGIYRWLGGPAQAWARLPFAPSVSVGATTLVLAAAGAAASRTGRVLAIAAAVLLWLALGTYGGADQLLGSVPIWGAFRYAEKLIGPLTLVVVVLASLGLDAIASGTARPGTAAMVWKLLIASSAVVLAVALVLSSGSLDGAVEGVPQWPLAAARVGRGLAHAGAALACLGGVLLVTRRAAWLNWRAPAMAGVCAAAALGAAPLAVNVSPRGIIDTGWLARLRSSDGPVRIATPGEEYPYFVPRKVVEAVNPVSGNLAAVSRHGGPAFTAPIGVDNVVSSSGLLPRRWSDFAAAVSSHPLLARGAWRRMGMTHVIQKVSSSVEERRMIELGLEGARAADREREWGYTAWGVPHRPWAFFARSVRLASGAADARAALRDVVASGLEDVVLEAATVPPLGAGRVLSFARGRDEVQVETEAAQAGLLVMADAFAEGWSARVDGAPVPVWAADGLIRAVPVPAGRHGVVLSYACPGLGGGAIASALALGVAAALVAFHGRAVPSA